VLNQIDSHSWIEVNEGQYRLVTEADAGREVIFTYGKQEPEFHRPTLHTPAYCEEQLPTIDNDAVDLIIDDPPYGNTHQDWDDEPNWDKLTEQYGRVLADDGLLILFGQQPSLIPAHQAFTGDGFEFRFELIWEKKNPSWVSHYQPLPTHENIWVFSRSGTRVSDTMSGRGFSSMDELKRDGVFVCGHCEDEITRGGYKIRQSASSQGHKGSQQDGFTSTSSGDRYPKSVIEFESDLSETQVVELLDRIRGAIKDGATTEQVKSLLQFNEAHPNMTDDPETGIVGQKPWRLIRWLLIAFSERGDTVLDPHMGSGTVPDVCIPLCRNAIGIEASLHRGERATDRVKGTLDKLRGLKHGTVQSTAQPTFESASRTDD